MSKEKGDIAEKKAVSFLKTLNFEIIKTNFFAKKLGEIDVIALKDGTYHFIEVKSANDYETATNNLSPSKLSKIKRSVNYYIQTNDIKSPYCIDAIIIVDDLVEFLENITM